MYVPNNRASNYKRQTLTELQRDTNESAIIFGDFTPPLKMVKFTTQKSQYKDTVELNNSISQIDIADIYRLFHRTGEYTFFSSSYGTFSKTDQILSYKTYLNTFKRIEIM